MKLKYKIAKLEDVAEFLRPSYEQGADGAYYLQTEGLVPKTQLDEFRANNIELANKLKTFDGVNIDEYNTLKTNNKKAFDEAVEKATVKLSQEQIDSAVGARTKSMKEESDAMLAAANGTISKLSGVLSVAMIDNSVRAEAARAGAHDSAIDDVVFRGRNTFKLGEDLTTVVAVDAQGQKLFDKDGQTPLQVSSWVKDLKKTAPHLFKGNNGSGASGSGSGAPGSGDTSKMSATQKIAHGLTQG